MITAIRSFAQEHLTTRTLRNIGLVYFLIILLGNVLRDSVQGVENSLLMLMIIIGIFLGWILAISNLKSWQTVIITLLSGGTILTIRVGRLGDLIYTLFVQIIELGIKTWRWIFQAGAIPRSKTIPLSMTELGNRIITLGSRMGIWIQSLFNGKPIVDPVATAIFWGILIWLIAFWMMWFIIRVKKPLLGIIPILTVTNLSLIYTGKTVYHLIPMLGFMIILVVMVRYDANEAQWKVDNLKYAGLIRERMQLFSIILAISLMLFATISPSISIRKIVDFIDRITSEVVNEDELVRSLGLEPATKPGNANILDERQMGGLPNRHLIGTGEELGDQIVMIIQVQELSSPVLEEGDPADQIYYWRSLTYDQYVGKGWVSRDSVDQEYDPGEKTLSSWPDSYQIIRQKVEFVEDFSSLLFSAGIPLSTNRHFQVAWRVKGSDQKAFDIFGASLSENQYTADSLQPTGSMEELRESGQDYPDWIRNRYISTPAFTPERVISLARDITATEPTPYDRAIAIESFLRRYPYTLDLPQPPFDQDIVDYFLFTAQRGYCDYYASAMVVLSRAAGLPARLVTGYIGGYYDQDLNAYLITADLAHAWAEIYFPGYGWIIFEPTGGRPEIDRPEAAIPKISQNYTSSFDPLVPDKPGLSVNWWVIILTSPFVIALIALGVFYLDEVILTKITKEKALTKIFRRIYRITRWMGFYSQPGDTHYEFITKLIQFMNQYGRDSKEVEWLMYAADLLQDITHAYYQTFYSPSGGMNIDPEEIILKYRNLRIRLWYLWLLVRAYPYRVIRYFLWESAPLNIS